MPGTESQWVLIDTIPAVVVLVPALRGLGHMHSLLWTPVSSSVKESQPYLTKLSKGLSQLPCTQ